MARCPFAAFPAISRPRGPKFGGPFKIVHHTTDCTGGAGGVRTNRDPAMQIELVDFAGSRAFAAG